MPTGSSIDVKFDDILQQDVDAIVNPANRHMLHGGGLAAMIASAAGPDLVKESATKAPIKTGESILTTAGNLPFRGVIHTVGPAWEGDDSAPYWRTNDSDEDVDELLARAHKSAIKRAQEAGYSSVAFPAVSCGVFRFPVERAAPIALGAVSEALSEQPLHVVFCLLDDHQYGCFSKALADLVEH